MTIKRKVNCGTCGVEIERENKAKIKFACHDCKKKRKQKCALTYKKRAGQEQEQQ